MARSAWHFRTPPDRRRSERRNGAVGRICSVRNSAAEERMSNQSILAIRLGAMGDIIHTLPAITTLKRSFPNKKLAWLLAPRWMPLLEGNPFVDELIPLDRRNFRRA